MKTSIILLSLMGAMILTFTVVLVRSQQPMKIETTEHRQKIIGVVVYTSSGGITIDCEGVFTIPPDETLFIEYIHEVLEEEEENGNS